MYVYTSIINTHFFQKNAIKSATSYVTNATA